jgi:predicted GNAT family acetyltransferase
MEVRQNNNKEKGSFFIEIDDVVVAELIYSWLGLSRMILEHTEVSSSLKGQGAGKLLVVKAIEYARENKIKIIPVCPYAKSVFEKTPEFRDVL